MYDGMGSGGVANLSERPKVWAGTGACEVAGRHEGPSYFRDWIYLEKGFIDTSLRRLSIATLFRASEGVLALRSD